MDAERRLVEVVRERDEKVTLPCESSHVPEVTEPSPGNSRRRVAGIAAGVTAANIVRAIEEWRSIGRQAFLRSHGGTSAQKYLLVEGTDEFDALALLRGARHLAGLPVAPAYRGDRANVAEPLRRLGFFVENLASETESPIAPDPHLIQAWAARFTGPTDAWSSRTIRREQGILRGALGIGTGDGSRLHQCGVCGRRVPERLLVAAHIKPRDLCTESERLDIPAIAMAACTLGCDALFEHGYLSVGESGSVLTRQTAGIDLSAYRGLQASAWNGDRAKYFEWHRRHWLHR